MGVIFQIHRRVNGFNDRMPILRGSVGDVYRSGSGGGNLFHIPA